jgi:hypothetical protein
MLIRSCQIPSSRFLCRVDVNDPATVRKTLLPGGIGLSGPRLALVAEFRELRAPFDITPHRT